MINSRILVCVMVSLLVTGCVTAGQNGAGPLTLSSNLKNDYASYLGQSDTEDGSRVYSAFAINPVTNHFGWHQSWGGLMHAQDQE